MPTRSIALPSRRLAGHKPPVSRPQRGASSCKSSLPPPSAAVRAVECDVRCETLGVDEAGQVLAWLHGQDRQERLVRARRGVILTAGGFTMNAEMVARHVPLIAQCANKIGTDGDDGRALRMAMGEGYIIHMDAAEWPCRDATAAG